MSETTSNLPKTPRLLNATAVRSLLLEHFPEWHDGKKRRNISSAKFGEIMDHLNESATRFIIGMASQDLPGRVNSPRRTRREMANVSSEMSHKIAQWFTEGNTGVSSKYMAGVALNGIDHQSDSHDPTPGDTSDLLRCIGLVEAVPEIRDTFRVLRLTDPVWAIFIDNWDTLTAMANSGDWNGTYKVMEDLRKEATANG